MGGGEGVAKAMWKKDGWTMDGEIIGLEGWGRRDDSLRGIKMRVSHLDVLAPAAQLRPLPDIPAEKPKDP